MNRLRRIMTEKVNAETAEQFVSGFINENEPWLLKVLEDYKSSMFHIADLTVPTIDDDYEEDNTDARSFTIPLAMEASPTTARFEPIFNMGPPPSRAGGCNLSKQTGINDAVRFTQHPFEDDTALKHFNDKRRRCHEPKSRYTEEDIIRGFACRVYWNARAQEEASDDDFIKSNESVKKKRQIADAAKGSAKKPGRGRGKKKSGEIGPQSGQAHDGSSGEDMEGSYREEIPIC
ncbi:hypothetical protein M406DRAFT_68531 [Cryphonectria parasitica EP155]|uniref:Uncharacterized protein n=1 Tax=Cryphonectria parasitica (strain ATCC 38755 / EP155) TaxID=660469 RepID=A0A9P5CQE8_CRYP1|nr:uncharacterized protein M406DRAFT_68531 [Cryphonectria parasitica EP155]KAF3766161.1 hypothetical protein M406DRAFT_68531 [Cryphonectria parasitica EP155]